MYYMYICTLYIHCTHTLYEQFLDFSTISHQAVCCMYICTFHAFVCEYSCLVYVYILCTLYVYLHPLPLKCVSDGLWQ